MLCHVADDVKGREHRLLVVRLAGKRVCAGGRRDERCSREAQPQALQHPGFSSAGTRYEVAHDATRHAPADESELVGQARESRARRAPARAGARRAG